MKQSIDSARTYFERVVVPNCEELMKNPNDVRIAFNAAVSFNSLAEWVFKEGKTGARNFSDYCEKLYAENAAIKVVHTLAKNAKHHPPEKVPPMTVGVSAAPTNFGADTARWGVFRWGEPEQEQVLAAPLDGSPKEWAVPRILDALAYWHGHFSGGA